MYKSKEISISKTVKATWVENFIGGSDHIIAPSLTSRHINTILDTDKLLFQSHTLFPSLLVSWKSLKFAAKPTCNNEITSFFQYI